MDATGLRSTENFYAAPAFAFDSSFRLDSNDPLARIRNLHSSLVRLRSSRCSTFLASSSMDTRVTPYCKCKLPDCLELLCHTLWGIHRFARVSTKIKRAQPMNTIPAITLRLNFEEVSGVNGLSKPNSRC